MAPLSQITQPDQKQLLHPDGGRRLKLDMAFRRMVYCVTIIRTRQLHGD